MDRNISMHIKVTEQERKAIEKVSATLGISMSSAVGYSVTNVGRIIQRNNKLKETK